MSAGHVSYGPVLPSPVKRRGRYWFGWRAMVYGAMGKDPAA